MTVHLSGPARDVFKLFYNAHNLETAELSGDLAAAWSKLEETPARLALILHCVRLVAGDAVEPLVCDADTMAAALRLTAWFKHEVHRVYAILAETPIATTRRKLIDWLSKRGQPVTARDVQQGCRWLKEPGAAEAALHDLVTTGHGVWQDRPSGPKGGRSTRVFLLSTSTQPAEPAERQGSVDVDTVDASPECEPGERDDWGAA